MSPAYLTLKPERFFLIDPAFFWVLEQNQGAPGLLDSVTQIIARIVDDTNWPMTVYVPWHYRNSTTALRLLENRMITVSGISICNARGGNQWLLHLGFRIGILNPVYQNVLIAAIFHSLKAGHRRILIWGAHHTWLKDVEVDERNRVLHALRHTEVARERQLLLNSDGSPRLYHVYLRQLSTVFEQYHVLRAFAQHIGAEIINATEESYIDAFDRIKDIDLFAPERMLKGD